jgi:glucans biosynthesis protein C
VLLAYTMTLQIENEEAYKHAIYFSMFLAGYWLAHDELLWQELKRLRKHALLVTIVAYALYMWTRQGSNDTIALHTLITVWIFRNLYIWAMLCSILGWGYHLLNHPFRWLPWANSAVYPWYILHQSVIIVLAYWLVPLKLGGAVEPILVGGGTILFCWLLTSFVIQRIKWLRPLFGLRPSA